MAQLKWGLIGCGDISQKRVAPALRDLDNVDFVGVSRANADLAESFAKEFGARKWYRDWQDLVKDDEIEAVYVATPVYLHAEQTIAAAEAGKHVLCEKPMALNVAQCDAMIDACQANGVALGVAYYRHFYPVIDRIKEIVNSGEIGTVVMAQINAFEYMDFELGQPRDWFVRKELSGGGPMFDFGCHRLEVLTNILGPAKATGVVDNVLFTNREVEDTATAILQFDNGGQGVICVTHGSLKSQDTVHLYGDKGSIHVPVLNEGNLTVETVDGSLTEALPPHPNFHQPHVEDFTNAVLAGGQPKVTGAVGREINQLLAEITGG